LELAETYHGFFEELPSQSQRKPTILAFKFSQQTGNGKCQLWLQRLALNQPSSSS